MSGFVDIHSHILWGLDDGAQDLETSLEMLRIAADNGTTDIVATPHLDRRYSFDTEKVSHRLCQLAAAPGLKPRIYAGCDFHLQFESITDCLENPRKYTINHLRYLMVEFSNVSTPRGITHVFERMIQAGITPVITHPERNGSLMKSLAQMAAWIRLGCRVQVTGQSFSGRFGKAAQTCVHELMSRRMVHFVASDAHDTVHRPPDLARWYELVADRFGEKLARKAFVENPAATLLGVVLDVEEPDGESKRRKWFFLN
jgi:protein-tyrosine phosphatase